MYLLDLEIRNLKTLRDFRLSFETDSGAPRQWTVLIGENGLCKTSILRAIACAASGYIRANQLEDVASLPDRRSPESSVGIEASFGFSELPRQQVEVRNGPPGEMYNSREYPGLDPQPDQLRDPPPRLRSRLEIAPKHKTFRGGSEYVGRPTEGDPITEASSRGLRHWFVAGYGTNRSLPSPSSAPELEDPALERLQPLFDKGDLIGTRFVDLAYAPETYVDGLRRALVDSGLLPQVDDMSLWHSGARGEGNGKSVRSAEDDSFSLKQGPRSVKIPATWMSQGYQSTIAWVADLIGQQLTSETLTARTEDMMGLVLIDELDLHLHPRWQADLVPTLKRVFPNMQFIVTTHSPMLLPGLEAGEIVVLDEDAEGDVVGQRMDESPALMTGSELYRRFFGIDRLYPRQLGSDLQRYGFLVGLPDRDAEETREMEELRRRLAEAGVDPGWENVEA